MHWSILHVLTLQKSLAISPSQDRFGHGSYQFVYLYSKVNLSLNSGSLNLKSTGFLGPFKSAFKGSLLLLGYKPL